MDAEWNGYPPEPGIYWWWLRDKQSTYAEPMLWEPDEDGGYWQSAGDSVQFSPEDMAKTWTPVAPCIKPEGVL